MNLICFASCFANELPVATAEFPPFKFVDKGSQKITGSDTEIIAAVFKSIGIQPKISMLPFKRADKLTRDGKFAAYYTFTKNSKREKEYLFSDPISSVQDVLFKSKSLNLSWKKYADLANRSLGYSEQYNYDQDFLSAIKDKSPIASENPEEQLLTMLQGKRFDMIICEVSVCSYIILKNSKRFSAIDYFDRPIGIPEPRPFYLGFSKKWPNAEKLRDKFNVALKKWASQPSKPRRSIFKKYGAHCARQLFPEC